MLAFLNLCVDPSYMEIGRDKSGLVWNQTVESDEPISFGDKNIAANIIHGQVELIDVKEKVVGRTTLTVVQLVARPTTNVEQAPIIYEQRIDHSYIDRDLGHMRTHFLGFRIARAKARARRVAKSLLAS